MPRSAAKLLRDAGHEAIDIRETPLRGAKDWQIAAHIKKESYYLITGDYDFADIRSYPPKESSGIVIINAGKDATAGMICELIGEFVSQSKIIKRLAGKLAIVEPGRVRLRGGFGIRVGF